MTKRELMELSNSKLDETVKIQGTNYDRKRKVTKDMQRRMIQMVNAGKSIYTVAEHFSVAPQTVKYNTDPEWRAWYNATRDGSHYGPTASVEERANYKRQLLENRNSRRALIYT